MHLPGDEPIVSFTLTRYSRCRAGFLLYLFEDDERIVRTRVYWLLGSSVLEIGTSRTVYPSFTACKRRQTRVKAGVVTVFSCSNDDHLT